jgi:hypothetical protein
MPTPLFMVLTPEHWKAWEFYKNTTRVRLLPTEWFAKFYTDDYNKWISNTTETKTIEKTRVNASEV